MNSSSNSASLFYRLSARTLSKGKNDNVVAFMSYITRGRIFDQENDCYFDYSYKNDSVENLAIGPAWMPDYLRNPSHLCRSVQINERRCDATLMKEIQLSFPNEIPQQLHARIVEEWVSSEFVDRWNLPAQISVHSDWHAHVAVPFRSITTSKSWSSRKIRELDKKRELFHWRKSWADKINSVLSLLGIEGRVDHRSNFERRKDAISIIEDEKASHARRVRAVAALESLNYRVSGKVRRSKKYRNDMGSDPRVEASRHERHLASLRAQAILDEYLADAELLDRDIEEREAKASKAAKSVLARSATLNRMHKTSGIRFADELKQFRQKAAAVGSAKDAYAAFSNANSKEATKENSASGNPNPVSAPADSAPVGKAPAKPSVDIHCLARANKGFDSR
ncbi:MAG: MobA/MobL family protein [Alphaproteobacteria bacterium]|nr:MobA/MobL family protein [Alphaproteobacteria bacterium]